MDNIWTMVITLLGGLAFFLFGMHVMSSGLERLAGGRLEQVLKKMTSNTFKSFLLGLGITAAIQSSSAVTVMLVGLVNSGLMEIGQTIGVIMGSNIGTTVTAWILSLSEINSENPVINLLNPSNLSPIIALIGILLIMFSRKSRKKDAGSICIGFAVLMAGMNMMGDAVAPLADSPAFVSLMTAFRNPLLGVLAGAVFTAIIQSSSASVGILQALSLTGSVTYGTAIPIIMGQNIGTCVTALISSIGVNKNARKVSVIHISFNLIGTMLFLCVIYGVNLLNPLQFLGNTIGPFEIAVSHSIFNIVTTAVLFPFTRQLEKIANFVIRTESGSKKSSKAPVFLDERLLNTPSFAASECNNLTVKMARTAQDNILLALRMLQNYDKKQVEKVLKTENDLDTYEDRLGSFLVKLSGKELSDSDSRTTSKLLHCIGDLERIGDHAVNLVKSADEIHEKGISFSSEARKELTTLTKALEEILALTTEAFETDSVETAKKVEPLEQAIDFITSEIKSRHVRRLQNGECTIETGFILSDLLNNYERVSDHCSNIAVAIIELDHQSFGTHAYLNSIKSNENREFCRDYEYYVEKYALR
ncbi:MAG TPA: Na/Pi cotransporter family protein [Candidatus Egerieisoma faecipullorum]|uniref:Na/Pi cotransporter family protein n=1 Tax=Candidatus Egerieisoma faecipullorum TaxID=2840963 RepID=A0A9D1I7Q4_9CLOT|nr:Na/Pi cotransporter family protein [Candidatus Egerieisoma faecipullorum]